MLDGSVPYSVIHDISCEQCEVGGKGIDGVVHALFEAQRGTAVVVAKGTGGEVVVAGRVCWSMGPVTCLLVSVT